jgi:hypothetical protein
MKASRKSSNAHIEPNVVGAGVGQRAKTCCSNRWVVLKNQRNGGLHAHGDGELPGAGLRTGAWGKKAEHAAQHEQRFHSAEFEAAVHRVKKQVTSLEVTCGSPNFLMQAPGRYSAPAFMILITLLVAYAGDFSRHRQFTSSVLAADWPGPRYSVERAAGTLVFRAGEKSKRSLAFRKQYFSHLSALGETPVFEGVT